VLSRLTVGCIQRPAAAAGDDSLMKVCGEVQSEEYKSPVGSAANKIAMNIGDMIDIFLDCTRHFEFNSLTVFNEPLLLLLLLQANSFNL
jgi:hypothetical protein